MYLVGNLKTQEGVSMKIINGVAIKFRIERRITRHTSSEHVKDVVILCICIHTHIYIYIYIYIEGNIVKWQLINCLLLYYIISIQIISIFSISISELLSLIATNGKCCWNIITTLTYHVCTNRWLSMMIQLPRQCAIHATPKV